MCDLAVSVRGSGLAVGLFSVTVGPVFSNSGACLQ